MTEALGPPLPPSMIQSAIEQRSTLSTGFVLLTGAQHMSKMAADLIQKALEAGVKEAAAAARKAKKVRSDEEKAVKKAEREAKKEAKAAAAASAAAAPRAKKRARSESEPPVAKKGKKAAAALAPAAPEPAVPRVDVRPGKRTRIMKPTDDPCRVASLTRAENTYRYRIMLAIVTVVKDLNARNRLPRCPPQHAARARVAEHVEGTLCSTGTFRAGAQRRPFAAALPRTAAQ